MANTIKLKRGTSTPSTSDIVSGEVAVDTSAKKLYINDSGTVKEIGGGGGTSTGETYVKYKDGSGSAANDGINTYAGYEAGNALADGANNNTLYGYKAGTAISTADHSTAVGFEALKSVTTAYGNTGIGRSAGDSITTGAQNTCLGLSAGHNLTTQSQNVCVGEDAMGQTKGSENTSVGFQSMSLAYFGDYNVALGCKALKVVGGSSDGSGGDYNVAIGYQAGDALETGNNNIIIGKNAAATSDSTSNEITLGNTDITKFRIPGLNFSLKDTTATDNYVLTVDANGDCGWEAAAGGGGVTSDSLRNTVGGTNAGDSVDGSSATDNTFFGYDAGTDITDGQFNVFLGSYAGANTNSGANSNTFIGYSAGENNGNAHQNVGIGYTALRQNAAWSNTVVGNNAGEDNTSGTMNQFFGRYAATNNTTGSYLVSIGYESLKTNTTGSNSVAIGHEALKANTTAASNTSIGYRSGKVVTTGADNTILGAEAGDALTTGSNNLILGHDAAASAVTVSNEITLGDTAITKFRIPGINFVVKDTTATDNYVLTVDSNGEAGWEAAGGGGGSLTLISSTTFTSAVSEVAFTSISGYTQYKIIFSLQTYNSTGVLKMRVGIDGTYDTGDNYNKGGSSDTSCQILGGFSAHSKFGEIVISNLNQTETTQLYSVGVGESNDQSDSNYQYQSGGHRTEAAQNCIKLYGASGNILSGVVSLYGFATS